MSLNNFASNLGIVVAGAAVAWLGANWPGLAVAALIAMLGEVKTLRDAYQSRG